MSKPLLYVSATYDRGYLKLLAAFLWSLKSVYPIETSRPFDLLIILDPSYETETYELLRFLKLDAKIWFQPCQTIMDAASARLKIFDWPQISVYSRAIWLDTDILITAPLTQLLELPLESKLYAYQQGQINNTGYGFDFFDFSKISYTTPSFNSGVLLFPICPEVQTIFIDTLALIKTRKASKKMMPPCAEQPFLNYCAISKGLYSPEGFDGICSCWPEGDTEPRAIAHFAMPIGDWKAKLSRMIEYAEKISLGPALQLEGGAAKIRWGDGPCLLEFLAEGVLKTHWGQGSWRKRGNLYEVYWSGFSHILFPSADGSFLSLRTKDHLLGDAYLVKN